MSCAPASCTAPGRPVRFLSRASSLFGGPDTALRGSGPVFADACAELASEPRRRMGPDASAPTPWAHLASNCIHEARHTVTNERRNRRAFMFRPVRPRLSGSPLERPSACSVNRGGGQGRALACRRLAAYPELASAGPHSVVMVSGYLGASKVRPPLKGDISMTRDSWQILFQCLEGAQNSPPSLPAALRACAQCTQWAALKELGRPSHRSSPAASWSVSLEQISLQAVNIVVTTDTDTEPFGLMRCVEQSRGVLFFRCVPGAATTRSVDLHKCESGTEKEVGVPVTLSQSDSEQQREQRTEKACGEAGSAADREAETNPASLQSSLRALRLHGNASPHPLSPAPGGPGFLCSTRFGNCIHVWPQASCVLDVD
ncbi:hypothetical protein H920_06002 [Fukomys damarensis]|uniref:Uncharacterized protein n=1 Tax=Fukomys damarensis TaxID=885580 RepID=A0A091EBE6_FUKDA|nr:hypothetical protein H920_06002 [Fukomys damarensis]